MHERKLDRPCDRRSLLCGLGAAGLSLMVGRGCTTTGSAVRGEVAGAVDAGAAVDSAVADSTLTPADEGFVGADGGPPPIDLAAPEVTQTATFALG